MRSGPEMGRLATQPLPSGGAPQRFGSGDKIVESAQVSDGYVTLAASGGPQRCIVWDQIRSDPQVGLVATKPLGLGGPQTLHSVGPNH